MRRLEQASRGRGHARRVGKIASRVVGRGVDNERGPGAGAQQPQREAEQQARP